MASVHQFNEALAKVRGVPLGTVEVYSRVLRREGVLPETKRGGAASPLTSTMAGYLLAAVMRGSPTAAADNAREVGDLIVHSDAILEPVLDRQLTMFSWPGDMSFAGAIGWLIDRYVDGTIGQFIDDARGIKVEVDRYWTTACLYMHPALPLVEQYIDAWREAFKSVERPPLPDRKTDGSLHRTMEIGFHTPYLHEAKISYGVNAKRNREAHRRFRELKKEREQHDLWGTETVTHRTLIAIAEAFKR